MNDKLQFLIDAYNDAIQEHWESIDTTVGAVVDWEYGEEADQVWQFLEQVDFSCVEVKGKEI